MTATNSTASDISISTRQRWPSVPEPILELMRRGAELALELATNPDVLDELEGVRFDPELDALDNRHNDPVLAAISRRATRTTVIHWLNAIIERPDQPVPGYLVEEVVLATAEMYQARAAQVLNNNAHSIQGLAWQYWMKLTFQLTQNPKELQQILELSAISISTFVDECLQLGLQRLAQNAEAKQSSRLEEQRDVISHIMAGDPVDPASAADLLQYSFAYSHHSAIVWSEEIDTEIAALETVASVFQQACEPLNTRQQQNSSSLKIIASPSVVWVWVAGASRVNEKMLQTALNRHAKIRISFGAGSSGVDGFRRAHLDAQAAQRVLGRLKSNIQLVSYERLRLMAFLSQDAKSIQHYCEHVLGDLAQAPANARQALHAFLECGCNATDAAKQLHTHRNTLLRRLAKAEDMLPRPLAENRIQVAVALEALYWIV